jgi:hypothetical protein
MIHRWGATSYSRASEDLDREIEAWQRSQLVREYVEAVRAAGKATIWALACADRIDPSRRG